MAQAIVCRHCGTENPAGAWWCKECRKSLERARPARVDPDTLVGRQLLLTLVREQRELINEQQRQTELLRVMATVAQVLLVLTILGIIAGILLWLLL